MGEKKELKVRLSTVVFLFIILVLIVALGVVYYLGFEKNDNSNNMIANGESTEKNNISVNEQVPDTNSNVDKIAKDLFEKGSQKIRETQYTDYYQYERVQPVIEKTINGVTYQKRNVLYANVEKEYSEIFTGQALKNVLGKRFAEVDGYLYVSYGGATGWDVTNIKLSRVSENNNEIEYTVTYNDVEIDDSITEQYSCKMTVKLVDGNYRISKTDYMGINKPETNDTENKDVLGTYGYDVPQEVKDEYGAFYDEITIELLANKTFKYYYGEGSTLEGIYQIENNNIICKAQTIEGDYLDKQEINVNYTFKYSDNTLELINKEGKVKFETSDFGMPNNSTEVKEMETVHEEIGSKFIKK